MCNPMMDQDNSPSMQMGGSQPGLQQRSCIPHDRPNLMHNSDYDRDGPRSRASSATHSDLNSEASRYNRARGPINDAVHSALDPIDPSHTTISPEILNQITSQITASVLQQLKATQYPLPIGNEQTEVPPFSGDSMATDRDTTCTNSTNKPTTPSHHGESPPLDRSKVYTPPSPYRAAEEAAQTTSPISPRRLSKFPTQPEPRRPPSPPFSHTTLSEDSDAKDGSRARARVQRTSTGGDGTILEKIWGTLFNEQGRPTTRLSQFLRGIAVHLIEDYEPKHSLVISPAKMQKYYEETKLTNETYPWQIIFDDRTSSISRMFREIEAQHHLVQDKLDERPDIPGLTPAGFETWMLLVLKAHPDDEFERLAYTALNMPVSNPDDRKERFPKELSRRQFPREADSSAIIKLQRVMQTHCGVKVPLRSGSMSEKDSKGAQPSMRSVPDPDNKSSQAPLKAQDFDSRSNHAASRGNLPDHSLSQTTTRTSVSDVDRQTLRSIVSEAAVDDSPIEVTLPPQIERERKPYVAQPGGGKNYDNLDTQTMHSTDTKAPPQSAPILPSPKLTRSSSLNNNRQSESKTRQGPPISIHQKPSQAPQPIDIPAASRVRTGSYHRDPPRRGERNRSPSVTRSQDVPHKSDGDVSYGSYHTSNSADHAPSSWRSDNRYDHRGCFTTEPRDMREPRQRQYSISTGDGQRYHPTNKDYPLDEDYHRSGAAGYNRSEPQYSSSQACPPNSYRSRA